MSTKISSIEQLNALIPKTTYKVKILGTRKNYNPNPAAPETFTVNCEFKDEMNVVSRTLSKLGTTRSINTKFVDVMNEGIDGFSRDLVRDDKGNLVKDKDGYLTLETTLVLDLTNPKTNNAGAITAPPRAVFNDVSMADTGQRLNIERNNMRNDTINNFWETRSTLVSETEPKVPGVPVK